MKRILGIILVFILSINLVFSYNPSKNDEKIIESLEQRVDKLIEKKGEKTRELLIKKLGYLRGNIKNNDKLVYILGELISHINNGIQDIEKIISTLENTKGVFQKIDNSEYILYKEYLDTYNTYIDAVVIGNWDGITGGCSNYGIKWEELYKEQFEEYYEIAKSSENYFIMDLMKYDIETFQTHYKKVCKGSWNLDNITFHNNDYSKELHEINTSYYLHIYLFYNEWFRHTYTILEDNGTTTTCAVIKDDWNRFTKERLEFFKMYTINTNSDLYYKKFNNFPVKFKNMLEKKCEIRHFD